ncbi:MAG: trypsin-like peptidase domain-containing protein [Clostridia bacterium]|nr:trypsin-like peptidase domain-containing protein [Clostridia bacterium]
MEEKNFDIHDEKIDDSIQVETIENKEGWFSDDFEKHFKSAKCKHPLAVYKPKPKRLKNFFRCPVVVAIISSIVTVCLCLGVFSFVYRPALAPGSVLPQPGDALRAQGYSNEIIQIATGASDGTFSIPDIYAIASPAVVTILCKSQSAGYIQSQLSSGSGIILREDGYIVTNNHVVEGASSITVNTIAGQSFDAELIGTDERTDIAVLKVESDKPLPFAELGDSSTLRVGELALAIGNPLREELAGTLTVGYISAINRSMEIDGKQMTMIQTDAAINPGNSGGALLNTRGQVIGINTAKSTGYDIEGLGFAIPINEAKPIIESIITHGYVTGRVVIGITGITVTEAIAAANDLPVGVYVDGILDGSAADKAGLKKGDVIIACDGQKTTTIDAVNKIRDTHSVGDKMVVQINRGGKIMNVTLTLQEEKPTSKAPSQPTQQYTPSPIPFSWFGW